MLGNIKVIWTTESKYKTLTQAQKDDLCILWVIYPDAKPAPVTQSGGAK